MEYFNTRFKSLKPSYIIYGLVAVLILYVIVLFFI